MKQLLLQYSDYNLWANKKITERVAVLPEEQVNLEIVSSFPSLYKTLLHMMEAENLWWERLQLNEHIALSGWYKGNANELTKELLRLSYQWQQWVTNASDAALSHVFAYYNSQKEYFKQPVYEMLMHLFNHQTYHRGQIVTMLRQLGVDKIPQTDFIFWSRKINKQRLQKE